MTGICLIETSPNDRKHTHTDEVGYQLERVGAGGTDGSVLVHCRYYYSRGWASGAPGG